MNTDPAPSSDNARESASASPSSSSSTRALIGILLAGAVGMTIFLFVHLSNDGGIRIRPGTAPAQGECLKGGRDCLPDISYVDTTGQAYSRAQLAGKVVLVNFWATWCHPCEKEIPDLSKTYEKYKAQGVVFLGVLIDNPDSQKLLNFQSDHDMSYPVVRSNPDLMASYNNPDAFPTTFVFDRNGKQVFTHLGALRERDLDSVIGPLVAQK